MATERVDFLTPEDVLKRTTLLRRIVRDVVVCQEARRKKQERVEELTEISRTFNSCEIQETINTLRAGIRELKRELETLERETRLLGGTLQDRRRGIVYFNSKSKIDERPILLVWDASQPETVSWHEVDESFADRTPVELSRGAPASAVDEK